jgi:hypothetical protein
MQKLPLPGTAFFASSGTWSGSCRLILLEPKSRHHLPGRSSRRHAEHALVEAAGPRHVGNGEGDMVNRHELFMVRLRAMAA